MGRKFKAKKSPFAALSSTWREAVDGMGRDEVQARIANTTLDHAKLEAAKKLDQDLEVAKARYTAATEVYRRGNKDFKLKVEYLRQRLDNLGGSTGAVAKDEAKATEEEIKQAADKFNKEHRASQ